MEQRIFNIFLQKYIFKNCTILSAVTTIERRRPLADWAISNSQKVNNVIDEYWATENQWFYKSGKLYFYSKTSFLVQIKFITEDSEQTHKQILILN